MPDGTYRAKIEFSSETGQGWTESWYDTSSASLDAAFDKAKQLATARGGLCGLGTEVSAWQVTDVFNPRLTQSSDFFSNAVNNADEAQGNPSDGFLAIATCRPDQGSRQVWLRGLPDDWVKFDPTVGRYQPVGAFQNAWRTFRNFLLKNNWKLRTLRSRKNSNVKSRVTALEVLPATGWARLTLDIAGTFNPTVNAIVSGFKYPLQHLNGAYPFPTGYSFDAGKIVLTNRVIGALQQLTYNGGAWVREQEFVYNQVTDVQIRRPGDRKVGKVSNLPVGRRSGK